MSIYAHMRPMELRRPEYVKSETTGQRRESGYQARRIIGSIEKMSQSDLSGNGRNYNAASYTLTTYDIDVRKGDTIADDGDLYMVQFVDMQHRRGPNTARLERETTHD